MPKGGWIAIGIIVLCLFTFFIGYQLGLVNTPQKAIKDRATELVEKNKRNEAIKVLELGRRELQLVIDAVELDVYRAQIYKNLARQYFMRDMWSLAIENAQKALEFLPTDSNLYFIIGVSIFQLSKVLEDKSKLDDYIRRAEINLEKAVKINPDYFDARYSLALVKIDLGDYKSALEHLNHILMLEPKDVPSLFARARVYYELGELLKSRDDYSKLLEILLPNDPRRKKVLQNIQIIDSQM
ncbi:MAG: tetratricopeptide repeat protein [Brevinematales bacterium]|nr:tetratricopeptide repeat protein [Brevinematales bacterium]